MLGGMIPTAWATAADISSGPCDLGDSPDPDDVAALDEKLLIATYLLFLETGSRWPGAQTDTVRPAGGSCGGRQNRGRCGFGLREVRLPGCPVREIVEVKVDGDVVPVDEYRVDDRRWLVRVNPTVGDDVVDGWPCCQRLDRTLDEDATFGITYVWGAAPPAAGVAAAKRLGCELSLASNPDTVGVCKLPIGVTRTISRQGVSIEVASEIDLAHCGLPEVTMWLAVEAKAAQGVQSGGRITDPYRLSRRGDRFRRLF